MAHVRVATSRNNLRVAAPPLSIADDPMRVRRACRMCTMPNPEMYKRRFLAIARRPICTASHAKSMLRQMRACVHQGSSARAAKSRVAGAQPINASATSESRNRLRSMCPQPYLIQSRATWQPGCLTPRDFFTKGTVLSLVSRPCLHSCAGIYMSIVKTKTLSGQCHGYGYVVRFADNLFLLRLSYNLQ
jgi:hypothetical protein